MGMLSHCLNFINVFPILKQKFKLYGLTMYLSRALLTTKTALLVLAFEMDYLLELLRYNTAILRG